VVRDTATCTVVRDTVRDVGPQNAQAQLSFIFAFTLLHYQVLR